MCILSQSLPPTYLWGLTMNELSALLAILMSFLTILGTLGGGLVFIFKFGSTFNNLTNGIERLNEHFSRLEGLANNNDQRIDDHEVRIVKLEVKEDERNEN